jgi:transcriptional regulator with PAS, ATPase and Fis domain
MVTMASGGDGEITAEFLPEEILAGGEVHNHFAERERVTVDVARQEKAREECEYIQMLLIKNRGNITKVANEIGLSRTSLYKKIHLYKIKA